MFLYVENRRMVTTEMYRSVMCVPEDETGGASSLV
jgi:hypothetical protein